MEYNSSMITTVTQKNMVTIPAELARKMGIVPGCQLEWQVAEAQDQIRVRMIPNRAMQARRLLGAGRRYAPHRDAVAELVEERRQENQG